MPPSDHAVVRLPHRDEPVTLVQLTDCHLCAEPGGTLLAMDTDHSLQAVVDQVRRRHRPQLVLGTGDLADDGAHSAYQRLQGYFAALDAPCFYLPGNHDDRARMAAVLGEHPAMCGEIRVGRWQVLMLDSQIPGAVGGRLGESQLARLESALAEAAAEGLHSLLCLHHQPVPVGCAWLDQQMVSDAAALFAVIDRFPGVAAVLWGHVHQEVTQYRGDVALYASPSTCVQFAPGSEDFAADDLPPGYRVLALHADGRIDTRVERVEDVAFEVDLKTRGYL